MVKFALLPVALIGVTAAVTACNTTRATFRSGAENHCHRVLKALTTEDYSVQDTDTRPRIEGDQRLQAVVISYRQGSAIRLITCLYPSTKRSEAVAISYGGRRLTSAEVAQANAKAR